MRRLGRAGSRWGPGSLVFLGGLSVATGGDVFGEAEAGELPACRGREEISVGGANVGGWGDAGATAEDDLRAHELAVVLAESSGEGSVSGVSGVGAGGPLPDVAEELLEAGVGGGGGGGGVEVLGFEEVGGELRWSFGRNTGIPRCAWNDRRRGGGGVLPFEFGGKAGVGPAGEGVGFEEAEVTDGGFGEVVEGEEAVEGVDAPAGLGAAVAAPVKRGLPAVLAEGGPAFGEPELGAVVGIVVDEGEVFGAGDEAGGQGEGGEVDLVLGGLVVEGEGGWVGRVSGGIGSGADVDKSGAEVDPGDGRGDAAAGLPDAVMKRRVKGIGVEGVLDVGGDEFEVLLLVMEAQGDALAGFVGEVARGFEEGGDGGVDVGAVGEDVGEWGAGEGGAEPFLGHVAEGVVVAVEEPVEVGVEGFVAGEKVAEDKGFEEPGGVGEVPFDWARLRTGLDHHVFGGEGGAEGGGRLAGGTEAFEETADCGLTNFGIGGMFACDGHLFSSIG